VPFTGSKTPYVPAESSYAHRNAHLPLPLFPPSDPPSFSGLTHGSIPSTTRYPPYTHLAHVEGELPTLSRASRSLQDSNYDLVISVRPLAFPSGGIPNSIDRRGRDNWSLTSSIDKCHSSESPGILPLSNRKRPDAWASKEGDPFVAHTPKSGYRRRSVPE